MVLVIEPSKDMLFYYDLHHCPNDGKKVYIKLKQFTVQRKQIIIWEKCQYLQEDMTCKHHNDGKQPEICKYPNKNGTGGRVYITPNCIYGGEKNE